MTRVQADGKRAQLLAGIDRMMISLYKKLKSEEWERLQEKEKVKYLLKTISVKSIKKVERALYNQRRLYVWYAVGPKSAKRIDLEFQTQEEAANVLSMWENGAKGMTGVEK